MGYYLKEDEDFTHVLKIDDLNILQSYVSDINIKIFMKFTKICNNGSADWDRGIVVGKWNVYERALIDVKRCDSALEFYLSIKRLAELSGENNIVRRREIDYISDFDKGFYAGEILGLNSICMFIHTGIVERI